MNITKKKYDDLKFITKSRTMKKNPSSKYLRSWNLHSKLYLVSCFYALLLMIGFEDLILIFYICVPNSTIEVIIENNNILNIILLLLIGVWPRKSWLSYTGALFWSTLLCLHPQVTCYGWKCLQWLSHGKVNAIFICNKYLSNSWFEFCIYVVEVLVTLNWKNLSQIHESIF